MDKWNNLPKIVYIIRDSSSFGYRKSGSRTYSLTPYSVLCWPFICFLNNLILFVFSSTLQNNNYNSLYDPFPSNSTPMSVFKWKRQQQQQKKKTLVNTLLQFFIPFQNKEAVLAFTIVIIAFCSCLDQNFTSWILELRLWYVQLECQAGLIPERVVKNLPPKHFQILIQNSPLSLSFSLPPSLLLFLPPSLYPPFSLEQK